MKETELIDEITQKTLGLMGFEGKVVIEEDGSALRVRVDIDEAGMLIGKGGENLRAFQHLLLLVISRKVGRNFAPGDFVLDVNNYRQERDNYLVALAKNTAHEVRENKRLKELQPMPASERRLIHITLAEEKGVTSESIGERDDRKIIIKPI